MTLGDLAEIMTTRPAQPGPEFRQRVTVLAAIALPLLRAGYSPRLEDFADAAEHAAWVRAGRALAQERAELPEILSAGGDLGAVAAEACMGSDPAKGRLYEEIALAAASASAAAAMGGL